MSIPSVPPTDGGAYELEHTIFNQALRSYYYQENTGIKLIPIAFGLEQLEQWNLDPARCLVLKPAEEGGGDAHWDAIKRSLDVLWSTNPFTLSTRLPFIVTIWDLQHRLQPFFPEVSELGGWPWQAREAHYSKCATKAFCCVVGTKRGRDELTQFYGVDPSRILVNPFPCPPPHGCASDDDLECLSQYNVHRQEYLLYPAQFWSHKNHLSALYALRILHESGCGIKLVLPGSDKGSLVGINARALSLGLSQSIITPGFVPREDLAALYRNCIALVYPSFFGPDNIPALEAMSYGVPAIVASVPGSHEQYGDSVLYFDPLKPNQLADAIQRIMTNQDLRDDLICKGLMRIKELTPEAYVARIEESLLDQKVSLESASLFDESIEGGDHPSQDSGIDQDERALLFLTQAEHDHGFHRIAYQEIARLLSKYRSTIAQRDNEISLLSDALAQRDNEISLLSDALAQRDNEISLLSDAINDANARLEIVRLSKSWRVTAPMRWLGNQLRMLRHEGIKSRARSFLVKLSRTARLTNS